MFLKWNNDSIRVTGRWDRRSEDAVTTTNTGGTIEIAYYGPMIVLHFDTETNQHPRPHLWIQVDGGARVEAAVGPYIRIQSPESADQLHYIKIIFKSAMEQQDRWYAPLVGKVSFKGADVDKPGTLAKDERKVIEFVGDSITEGVLIDVGYGTNTQEYRVYHDDACATYAWLTAEKLNLIPRLMGYGAVGATKSGQGRVPKAALAYPYVYDGCPLSEKEADYIIINHGANDRRTTAEEYGKEYFSLLEVVRKLNPNAKIVSLSAFAGVYPETLNEVVHKFNEQYNDTIYFIDSTGWISPEPLHPLRDGHRIVAENLAKRLEEIIR